MKKIVLLIIFFGACNYIYASECPSSAIKEKKFSEEDIGRYRHTFRSPDVIYLRKAFNSFLAGKMSGGAASPDEYKPLKNFSKSYFKSKFSVFNISKDIAGQVHINIIFQDKPDKMFSATTYNGFELRNFEDLNLSKCDLIKIRTENRTLLEDKSLSI